MSTNLIEQLSSMPIKQLEAIYNTCWRNHHNDIDPNNNKLIMDSIEFVAGAAAIGITGKGGSFEFHQSK